MSEPAPKRETPREVFEALLDECAGWCSASDVHFDEREEWLARFDATHPAEEGNSINPRDSEAMAAAMIGDIDCLRKNRGWT